jgi:hypothetical protein
MLRRVYQAGIDDKHWVLIKSLHENAVSSAKWADQRSEPFEVNQGVRQGGILSTDLYKLYINPLQKRLEATNIVGIVCAPGLNSLVFKDLLFGFALMFNATLLVGCSFGTFSYRNNTAIVPTVKRFSTPCFHRLGAVFIDLLLFILTTITNWSHQTMRFIPPKAMCVLILLIIVDSPWL